MSKGQDQGSLQRELSSRLPHAVLAPTCTARAVSYSCTSSRRSCSGHARPGAWSPASPGRRARMCSTASLSPSTYKRQATQAVRTSQRTVLLWLWPESLWPWTFSTALAVLLHGNRSMRDLVNSVHAPQSARRRAQTPLPPRAAAASGAPRRPPAAAATRQRAPREPPPPKWLTTSTWGQGVRPGTGEHRTRQQYTVRQACETQEGEHCCVCTII